MTAGGAVTAARYGNPHAPLPRHTSGGQHCELDVHCPHVPLTHAWLPQSLHDPHATPASAPASGAGLTTGHAAPAARFAVS